MFVYSGPTYRFCQCGLLTDLKSIKGEQLKTGDIVVMYCLNENGVLDYMGGLSVVICDQFKNYQGGVHELVTDYQNGFAKDAFVMGIKEAIIGEKWHAELVKHCEDIVDGEHWKEFGFNYKNE